MKESGLVSTRILCYQKELEHATDGETSDFATKNILLH